MSRSPLLLALAFAGSTVAVGQDLVLEGYVFEENNAGYLREATVTVLDAATDLLVGEAVTDGDGAFAVEVPRERDLLVRATKRVFAPAQALVSTRDLDPAREKVFVKLALARQPGYTLEVTLAELRDPDLADGAYEEVDAIQNSLIEVYNNTRDSAVLVLADHPSPSFSFRLEQGNHYTLLIRSPGFFTKRIESYVNVDGCILCMDGVAEIGPGVSDNLAYGNEVGTLLANVELERMRVDSAIALNNIYYEYDSYAITEQAAAELEEVVEMLRVNPSVEVELGSHTDSRGDDESNLELSQRRAQAAVDYLVTRGIDSVRLVARGYGESQLTNVCVDDVECSDEEHAANRRTELRITGFTDDPFAGKPLAEILAEERFGALLAEVLAGEEYRAPGGQAAAPGEPVAAAGVNEAAGDALERLRGDLADLAEEVDPTSPEAIAAADAELEAAREAHIEALRSGAAAEAPASQTAPRLPPPARPRSRGDATEAAAELRRNLRASADPTEGGRADATAPERPLLNAEPLRLPAGGKYTGYRVLVFQSALSLGDDEGNLFFKYGTLQEDELADGSYGYMSGAFPTEAAARAYLADVSALFPEARVLRYVNGFVIDDGR